MSPPTYHRLTLMKQSCFMKSPLSRSIHQERLDSGVLLQPLQMSTGQKWPHILRKAMFHLKTCLLYASLPCAFLAQMPLSSAFFHDFMINTWTEERNRMRLDTLKALLITQFNFHDKSHLLQTKIKYKKIFLL